MRNKVMEDIRKAFLEGREYERKCLQKEANKKQVLRVFREVIAQFPSYMMPVDGHGEEDSYNRGYNQAIDDLSKIVLDAINNTSSFRDLLKSNETTV